MRALSLWQPHATAIGLGLKPWETRDWPTHYRGLLAIHAAKRPWTDVGDWHTEARRRFAQYVAERGPIAGWAFGAVVATCELVECIRTSELRGRILTDHEFWGDFSDGEDSSGRWAFRLENVQLLAQPVVWRGQQGFFDVELGTQDPAPMGSPQGSLFGAA